MSIYEHFRPEEKLLIDRFIDWRQQAEQRYVPKLTDFLDPRRQQILRSVVGEGGAVRALFNGGYGQAERKRALLLPPYGEAAEDDFQLGYVEVVFPARFVALTHRQLLGAVLGCGVERSKIGDLIVTGERAQFICTREIESFLLLNLTAVGRTHVECRPIGADRLLHKTQEWSDYIVTVSSLRLDAVVSEVYRLSRTKSAAMIARGMVKVNWAVEDQKDAEVYEGDVLSLRGYGRSKIISVDGSTKKHKIRLQYGKLN